MFVVFEIYEVKDLPFWPPKIPFKVTYDLNYDIMGLRMTGSTILPVKHILNNLEVKACV